jgi:hypothetical protein
MALYRNGDAELRIRRSRFRLTAIAMADWRYGRSAQLQREYLEFIGCRAKSSHERFDRIAACGATGQD